MKQNTTTEPEEHPQKPFPYEKYLLISQYFNKIGLKDITKTHKCKHEFGCLYNTINQTFKAFALGYSAKSILNIA